MSVFAQYLQPFSSKNASITPENRCFLQNVAIGGNKKAPYCHPLFAYNQIVKCKCGKCDIKFEKTHTYVLGIFVSQASHQNPIGINTIALVSSWENV